jgi:FdhD protein
LNTKNNSNNMLISPNLEDKTLVSSVTGKDHLGQINEINVIEERPLSIYLNSQEIVTAMTIGDHPKYLALGFLKNQKLIKEDEKITGIDFDDETRTVVVRTENESNYEQKIKKKIRTSGCAVGTVFGDMMESVEEIILPESKIKISWLYDLAKEISQINSLYLEVGAIHGTVLCLENKPLIYMEDVGRHNAVDKVAGWLFSTKTNPEDKILYTTGRLTSEMVVKCANMGIPTLVSRSGFTAWGVELAKLTNMTLIGRLRGKRFVCLSGENRLIYDAI